MSDKIKKYEVSLVVSNIEAKTESEAIERFDEWVKDGAFGRDSYEVVEQKD